MNRALIVVNSFFFEFGYLYNNGKDWLAKVTMAGNLVDKRKRTLKVSNGYIAFSNYSEICEKTSK